MTIYQIKYQHGNARILTFKGLPDTPWLFNVNGQDILLGMVKFNQIILTDEKILNADKVKIGAQNELEKIPDYSFLEQQINPDPNYDDAYKYEFSQFLARLDKLELPNWLGFTLNCNMENELVLFQIKKLMKYKPSCFVLKLKPIDYNNTNQIIRAIVSLRQLVPENIAIYLPGGAPIGFQSLLMALGVDIFDNGYAAISAYHYLHYRDGFLVRNRRMSFSELLQDNIKALKDDFIHSRSSLEQNTLWSRVYRDMHASAKAAGAVKKINKESFPLSKFNIHLKSAIDFIGEEALYHPLVQFYQKKLVESYKIPESVKLIIILPCSAKKPYKDSRSHKFYRKTIKNALGKNKKYFEIWTLTSPLGVVPSGLETIFPAKYYDIAVSGDWTIEESERNAIVLQKMLGKISKEIHIIAHLSLDYKKMIEIAFSEREYNLSWLDEKPTSSEALSKLYNTISELKFEFEGKAENARLRVIADLIRWQFGNKFKISLSNLKFKGNPAKQIIATREGVFWFAWNILSSKILCSIEAIKDSNLETEQKLYFNGDKLEGSTIFAPGILQVGDFSPEDEVLIYDKSGNNLIGIGNAVISSETAGILARGPVLKIRKKAR